MGGSKGDAMPGKGAQEPIVTGHFCIVNAGMLK